MRVIVLAVTLALTVVSATAAQPQRSSAESKWIVFTGTPGAFGYEQIFRMKPSGKRLKQLTRGSLPSTSPAFSPNGKRIAFTRLGVGVLTMNVNGTGVRRLTKFGRDSYPAWSPDGKQIAFLRPFATGWRIHVMTASGKKERRLPKAPPAGRPSWTARGLLIPTNGDLARIDPRSGRVLKLYGALIDASVGMDTTAVSPDLSTVTWMGPRRPDPGDKSCGEGVPCPHFGLYIQDLARHRAPRMLARNAGPASFSLDGKTVLYTTLNRLVFRVLKTNKTHSVRVGKIHPTTSSPPSWQLR
jgi:Tol biopolymer transport system component